jgi:tRNA(fMet)-specific endonuclease VapC
LMKLMLDTNICIYLIKQQPVSVLKRFAAHAVGDLGLSAITLAELEYGVAKSTRPAKNREALDAFVSPLDFAAFDRPATAAYGRLRTMLEKKGQPIGSLDLLIAAHAVSLEVRLVTHNVREFGKVPGLRIEDWA